MNHPIPPNRPTVPVKPERSRVATTYENVPFGGSLQEALDNLAAKGITDLTTVSISTEKDRCGDFEQYVLEWRVDKTETMNDCMWAATMAAYNLTMKEYEVKLAEYQVKHDKWCTALVAHAEWQRQQELVELARLQAKYPTKS